MKARWSAVLCASFIIAGLGTSNLQAQESTIAASVLHIQQTQTTSQGSQNGFPTYLVMYHVLDGAKSPAEVLALMGTISLKNYDPTFSEVLWILAYWQGKCPAHDINLSEATILWSDILKNPSLSNSTFTVNLDFPHPLPMTGCVGLYYGGGPLFEGKATMSADLNLTYKPVTNSDPDTVLDLSGEYCFGQDWGCQNATAIDGEGFAVPVKMQTAGHLLELFGNISDSTFHGTQNFGPLPKGKAWGAINDFYLLPGGCGKFGENLNSQGFPNAVLLATLYSWLPDNALHLESVPLEYEIPRDETGKATLQKRVARTFPVPVTINAGITPLIALAQFISMQ